MSRNAQNPAQGEAQSRGVDAAQPLLIGGRWCEAGGEPFESRDPVTDDLLWRGRAATGADVSRAVAAARDAFGPWFDQPFDHRRRVAEAFARQLTEHRAELAEIISRETGKPLWEAEVEVGSMSAKVGVTLAAFSERRSDEVKSANAITSAVRFKPHGVLAVLGPFNFPGHLPNGHIVPALLAGNTVVFKPSEHTPMVAQRTAELWQQSGLPDGVVNLVQGAHETGKALASHDGIDGLLFTGGYETGLALNRAFADHPERILALELGGNNPLVVDGMSDVDAAVYTTIVSAYATSGQRCSCARRLIVVDSERTAGFVDRLVDALPRIRVGRYTDRPQPFMGSLISKQAAERMMAFADELVAQGGEPLVPMTQQGAPTLLTPGLIDMTGVESLPDKEAFGPLLQLIRVSDFDSAIAVANQTKYGLAAGLLCDDRKRYDQFLHQVRAGVVNWNRPTTGASSSLPFGGVGCSGNHRPSGYYAVDYCTYPVASLEQSKVRLTEKPAAGLENLFG